MQTFKQYFSELAMKKGTTVRIVKDTENDFFAVIVLENDDLINYDCIPDI